MEFLHRTVLPTEGHHLSCKRPRAQTMSVPLVQYPHLENHCAILSWAGFLANPCKMCIKCPPPLLCSTSHSLKLGVFVMLIDSRQNSWIPLAPPSHRQTFDHPNPIRYPFLSLSLQIRDWGSCGNMEDSLQAASGISAAP